MYFFLYFEYYFKTFNLGCFFYILVVIFFIDFGCHLYYLGYNLLDFD